MGDYYEEDKYYLIIRSTGLFNGKVVEALNESLGVVYRDVASTGKIVVIGRP